MTELVRGVIVDVDLEPVRASETGKTRPAVIVTNDIFNRRVPVLQVVPLTGWNEKKASIRTNITPPPSPANGLTRQCVADCLQTRPIDRRHRILRVRGTLEPAQMAQIEAALRVVFQL